MDITNEFKMIKKRIEEALKYNIDKIKQIESKPSFKESVIKIYTRDESKDLHYTKGKKDALVFVLSHLNDMEEYIKTQNEFEEEFDANLNVEPLILNEDEFDEIQEDLNLEEKEEDCDVFYQDPFN